MSNAAQAYRYEEIFQIEKTAAAGGGVFDDPYPIWKDLQAKAAVHKGSLAECMGLRPERNGGGLYRPGITYYSVFSFAGVSDAFIRKDDFSSEVYVDMGTRDRFGDSILNMDGLRHRRYRDLIQANFQPEAAEGWWRETVIAPTVDELIGNFAGARSVDLNARFFALLPLHAMTVGFGMSFDEGLAFRGHMLRSLHGSTAEERAAALAAADGILDQVIHARRRAPRDDLISKLSHAMLEDDDGSRRKLTVEEIATFCRIIVFGGSETTWLQLGVAIFALLNNPDQLADVRRDRSLLPNVILESARWYPPPFFSRKVKRDTVLEGVAIPKDAVLHLCLGAANRDPARWSEPDRFDVHRPVQRSLAFAAGAHSCLGQHVAREEARAALAALFDRFPNMRWDPSKPPARLTGSLVQRGPGPLHVLLQ